MCPTCAVVSQTNHSCGHQVRRYMCKAKFCLFFPHEADEFHMVTYVYKADSKYWCEYCEIKGDANDSGLRGAEKHDFIKTEYDRSGEARQVQNANEVIAAADNSQNGVDAAKIAELNKTALSEIKWYLKNRCSSVNDKALLLKTILQVPQSIDRKALVECFGSYVVYDQKQNIWKGLSSKDRGILTSIARRAGMFKTLDIALKMQKPVDMQ
ncbi:hypothetical protein F5Y13DRAFT_123650 [Hypoxylon sp. FL1857]|nr:hypothetical protein F5Y13DRAFT_123650 [Hypoxylon sp. FL1857]